jgi:hypothetical protein
MPNIAECLFRRMGLSKGPKFVNANAARHRERTDAPLWYEECAAVDVEALRVKLSVDYVRYNGGLSYEDRRILKARISAIQRPKDKRERRAEMEREKWNERRSA